MATVVTGNSRPSLPRGGRLHVLLEKGVVLLRVPDAVLGACVCRFVDVPAIIPDVAEGAKRDWTPAKAAGNWRSLMMMRTLIQTYGFTWDVFDWMSVAGEGSLSTELGGAYLGVGVYSSF